MSKEIWVALHSTDYHTQAYGPYCSSPEAYAATQKISEDFPDDNYSWQKLTVFEPSKSEEFYNKRYKELHEQFLEELKNPNNLLMAVGNLKGFLRKKVIEEMLASENDAHRGWAERQEN